MRKASGFRNVERALVSVFGKTGIVEFARALEEMGVEVISSGGTAALLKKNGLRVIDVAGYTGFPECLGGRVKTLHPKIHAGILARRGKKRDELELRAFGIKPIDLVVVDLYPFKQTVGGKHSLDDAIEKIDVGGVALIRAAAKNFEYVAVATDAEDRARVLAELKKQGGALSRETRFELAEKAFAQTAAYDAAVHDYFSKMLGAAFPRELFLRLEKQEILRYGENPHQKGAIYAQPGKQTISRSLQLAGKELSYNNVLDADAALALVKEFKGENACVIVKHNNPCGGAVAKTLREALEKAIASDPVSAFGGVYAFSKKLDAESARVLEKHFVEVVFAPGFEPKALEVLRKKENTIVLDVSKLFGETVEREFEFRSVLGGALVQTTDDAFIKEMRCVTRRKPSAVEKKDLLFALKFAKHAKSNAVVLAKSLQLIGIGAGQMSRIDSTRIALDKARRAGFDTRGAVLASDAFFPFRDNIDEAAKAGASAVIQPGGSKRDAEVIRAANEWKIAMVFTGVRHFKH